MREEPDAHRELGEPARRPPAPTAALVVPPSRAPDREAVRRLYAAAAAAPPLSEPPATAELFADVYANSLQEEGLRIACEGSGEELAGVAYGHVWRWADQDYAWARELRERLGEGAAAVADGAFVVCLLAVHPATQGMGLGRRLLRTVVPPGRTRWLVTTDIDSPAARLYASEGWTALGHGPDAPDGRPGLVLVSDAHARSEDGGPQGAGTQGTG